LDHKYYWAGLASLNLPVKVILGLVQELGSAKRLWEASGAELKESSRLEEDLLRRFCRQRDNSRWEETWEKVLALGCHVLTLEDENYPVLLAEIYDPPLVLYHYGELYKREPAMAMVGSRTPTPYGSMVAEELASELAGAGITIVSGMARGIDSACHRGSLKAGGRTIAVLGSGLDIIYPPENRRLAREIAQGGSVLTEFPPGTSPEKRNFPKRNRVISGLSWGTIVVEAGEKSGALITTDFALEQGRDVFAVPGPITSKFSVGTNRLIKQGAILVESSGDVLDYYQLENSLFQESAEMVAPSLSPDEETLLSHLSLEPVTRDELAQKTNQSPATILTLLTFLETRGMVKSLPGQRYILGKLSRYRRGFYEQ